MLICGQYKTKDDDSYNNYEIIISVKETEKSYIFNLISNNSRYSPAHIDMLFSKSNKVRVDKAKSQHAIRVWSDKDFTIYPFRVGIPFYFELMNEETHMVETK